MVSSISYGIDEDTYLNFTTDMQAVETNLIKLGIKGHTIFVASGDDGPYPQSDCSRFIASYPASSHFVTSVGAT